MPFENNGMVLSGGIFMSNGEKLCEVASVPEFIDTTCLMDEETKPCGMPGLKDDYSIEMEFKLSDKSRRNIVKSLVYNWRNKGPLRKRLLKKVMPDYMKWILNLEIGG